MLCHNVCRSVIFFLFFFFRFFYFLLRRGEKGSQNLSSLHFIVSLPCFHLACLVCVSSDCSTAHKILCCFHEMNMYVRTYVQSSLFGFNRLVFLSVYVCNVVSSWLLVGKKKESHFFFFGIFPFSVISLAPTCS